MTSSRRRRPRRAYVMAALVLVAIVVSAGVLVGRSRATPTLATAPPPGYLDVARQSWRDERPATLTLTLGGPGAVRAPRAGMVTATACTVGASVASGSAPVELDGVPVLALATGKPLWRDPTLGDSGADVVALHTELSRLGQSVSGEVVTAATIRAFNAAATAEGAASVRSGIAMASVLWLPASAVRVHACPAPVGTSVQAGSEVMTLTPPVVSARLAGPTGATATGEREFEAGGQSLALTSDGVDRDGLAWLNAHPDVVTTVDGASTVRGIDRLRSPIEVYAVPAVALRSSANSGQTCVVARDGPHPVTVVGSQLGSAYVTSARALTAVSVDPAASTCP